MQILEALARYNERPVFVKEAFFHLFLQTCFMKITKPEILKVREFNLKEIIACQLLTFDHIQ